MDSNRDEQDISAIYDKSRRLRTSAEIVKEARMSVSLTGDRGGARLVAATRRPETPAYARGRWARRNSSMTRLLPMVSELDPSTSRSSKSIHNELESPWNRLDPLPEFQRSQSVCDNVEKRTNASNRLFVRRRRPLSMVSTNAKCDEAAFSSLRQDIESRKLLRPSPLDQGDARSGISSSLPSLRLSPRTLESGYDSRLSSASIDETGSIATDDEQRGASSLPVSPRINENVQMHLKQLSSYCSEPNRLDEELDAWMESFLACLANGKLFKKRGQTRTLILQRLFLALDHERPKLTIRILAVILEMNMSSFNLAKACKSIYALSGDAENHKWICHDIFLKSFVDALKRLSLNDSASMLYLICTVDILVTNDPIRKKLSELPIFDSISHVMTLLIVRLSREVQPNQIPTSAILTPTLSSIRTLLEAGRMAKQAVLAQDILPKLVYVMKAMSEESELVLYGMRTLSKLSLSEECCELLVNVEPDIFICAATWLELYSRNREIIVRLLFILGNLLSVIERAQWQLFQAPGAVAAFQEIFDHFSNLLNSTRGKKFSDVSSPIEDDRGSLGGESSTSSEPKSIEEIEDVLIKLARVVANLSVHPGIGSTLCQNERILDQLCTVLELAASRSITDELTVNALVALHNLSYYAMDEATLGIINGDQQAVAAEACSLLANLSRDDGFCAWIVQKKVHTTLISFLSITSNMQLTKSAAGTLINVSRSEQYKRILMEDGLLTSVLELLKRSISNYNWYLGALAVQIICNIVRPSIDDRLNGNHEEATIDRDILREIADLLLESTEDAAPTSPHGLQDAELNAQLRQLWEYEFCSASTELLEILDAQLSNGIS